MKILFVACYANNGHYIDYTKKTLDKYLINCDYDYICLNDAPDIQNGDENYLKICDILTGESDCYEKILDKTKQNNGAGLIDTWKYNKDLIQKYDWIIHFELRQLLKSFQFVESFLKEPRNLFTININVEHFNTGLFCISKENLLNYINNCDLNKMVNNSISIEDDLYKYFQDNKLNYDTLEKMDLLWFAGDNNTYHY